MLDMTYFMYFIFLCETVGSLECFVAVSIGQIAELWDYTAIGALCSKVCLFACNQKRCLRIHSQMKK